MPEYPGTTLCRQLEAERQGILALRSDLKVAKLAGGAKDAWRFRNQLDLSFMSVTAFEPLAGPLGAGFTLRIADKGGESVAGTRPKRGGLRNPFL
jgi:hypothetical protein